MDRGVLAITVCDFLPIGLKYGDRVRGRRKQVVPHSFVGKTLARVKGYDSRWGQLPYT